MPKIIVSLPKNRDFAGTLRLEDAKGSILAGPFAVCGRADAQAAKRHGNLERNPLLPYGDTPLGRYRVAEILPSGDETALFTERFGASGVIVLHPQSGEAALADANGRFHIIIHGGKPGPGGRLRATNGSLRLSDKDMARLVRALRKWGGDVSCECSAMPGPSTGRLVARGLDKDIGDPPLLSAFAVTSREPSPASITRSAQARDRFSPPTHNLFVPASANAAKPAGAVSKPSSAPQPLPIDRTYYKAKTPRALGRWKRAAHPANANGVLATQAMNLRKNKLMAILESAPNILFLIVHGDSRAVYLPSGEKLSAGDLAAAAPAIGRGQPMVFLISQDSGAKAQGLRSLAQAFKDAGASMVWAFTGPAGIQEGVSMMADFEQSFSAGGAIMEKIAALRRVADKKCSYKLAAKPVRVSRVLARI